MKTNISIELSDAERNVIANLLKGKETKSMVSRSELNDMVQGFVKGVLNSGKVDDYVRKLDSPQHHSSPRQRDSISQKLQQSLESNGYHESHPSRLGYIRGWNSVGK